MSAFLSSSSNVQYSLVHPILLYSERPDSEIWCINMFPFDRLIYNVEKRYTADLSFQDLIFSYKFFINVAIIILIVAWILFSV